jgi:hypothetical protein
LPTCPSTVCIREPLFEVLSDALLSAVTPVLTMLGSHYFFESLNMNTAKGTKIARKPKTIINNSLALKGSSVNEIIIGIS